jgi:hypothetical protein
MPSNAGTIFSNKANDAALRDWCADNGLELSDGALRPPAQGVSPRYQQKERLSLDVLSKTSDNAQLRDVVLGKIAFYQDIDRLPRVLNREIG